MLIGLVQCHGIHLLVPGLFPPVVFSMQLAVASETQSTIPTSLLVFVGNVFTLLIYYIQYDDCTTIGKLSITQESHISEIDSSKKWHRYGSFWPSHSERFTCCALTIQYIICSTVGRPITSISNIGEHICLSRTYWLWTSLPYYVYILRE